MKKCTYCDSLVATHATKCPNCCASDFVPVTDPAKPQRPTHTISEPIVYTPKQNEYSFKSENDCGGASDKEIIRGFLGLILGCVIIGLALAILVVAS